MTQYEMMIKSLKKHIEIGREFCLMIKNNLSWELTLFQYDVEEDYFCSYDKMGSDLLLKLDELVIYKDRMEQYSVFYPEDLFEHEKQKQIFL